MNNIKVLVRPIDITINARQGDNLADLLVYNGIAIDYCCGGTGVCKKCTISLLSGNLPEAAKFEDKYLSCRSFVLGDIEIMVDVSLENHVTPTSYVADESTVGQVISAGLAVDIGTTGIEAAIIDLDKKKMLASVKCINSQSKYGADVISRIIFSQRSNGLKILNNCVISDINKLIHSLCNAVKIDVFNIKEMAISANPTMNHIFANISPSSIRIPPYEIQFQELEFEAQNRGLNLPSCSAVNILTNHGSYVGGDITAGILSTGIHLSDEVSVLIDIGTNAEVVVGCKDWLLSCACSAGPAFEGAGVSCGMRAATGAIDSFKIIDGQPQWTVIGNINPKGICGSGMIDLIAELYRSRIIDRQGRFLTQQREYNICSHIAVTENDIQNIIRAKGAIFAGVYTLLNNAGIGLSDVHGVFVAGGIGEHINFENAVQIGLLPDIPKERYKFVGNASLDGAAKFLADDTAQAQINEIKTVMSYVDISSMSEYMDLYVGSLFIPHTDKSLFPSIKFSN